MQSSVKYNNTGITKWLVALNLASIGEVVERHFDVLQVQVIDLPWFWDSEIVPEVQDQFLVQISTTPSRNPQQRMWSIY